MTYQDIIAQLQQQGFYNPTPFGDFDPVHGMTFTPGSIMYAAGRAAGLTDEQIGGDEELGIEGLLTPQMFTSIPESLQKGSSLGAYSSLFQSKQSILITDLIASLGGKKSQRAYGNFAGSGGANIQRQKAKDMYGREMLGAFGQAQTQKTQALGQIQSWIDNWLSTAQSFAGPQV